MPSPSRIAYIQNLIKTRKQRQCSVPGCGQHCHWKLTLCYNHDRRKRLYGKPTARRIDPREWRPYALEVRRSLEKSLPREALEAAHAMMRYILDPGPQPRHAVLGPGGARYHLWRSLSRLATFRKARPYRLRSKNLAHLALVVAMAVWAMSRERPDILPDDIRLTKAISYAVFGMACLKDASGGAHQRHAGVALIAFGTSVRESFGLLLHWLEDALPAQRHARNVEIMARLRRRTAKRKCAAPAAPTLPKSIPVVPLDEIS